ncbi:DUF5302 domain-containing protein [Rhodococcus triatomae]|uniref:DUF5302 domain-containing protein n=1 Tax=Rhodococcus triatomae TaxID=300028 RepID=A0A1G8EQG2_9NOCA|nr:DUF5302 domain-containing protein [Rhodococcus triatomae]QNG19264.1 DUF5302 domain-containing protein [Rhodococcus triatomae]QNG24823.1 DUF5302 domain-containing protein [Rhodococcus triatomae]SDH72082.1 hypothetical protein SAMN05444695_10328 [Rhodococcus triatomae]
MTEPSEETKRKFLEALERKNRHAAGGTDHLDSKAKVDHPHGPADHKREFRRKSG